MAARVSAGSPGGGPLGSATTNGVGGAGATDGLPAVVPPPVQAAPDSETSTETEASDPHVRQVTIALL
jgi:hypothetical protein